jgi:GntR family transcriptional regulator
MFSSIDPKSAVPIYRQIMDQISRSVAAGILAPGDQLPSVRELAARLLVNPNTVARVYRDLERDGLLETRRGQGTYIAAKASAMADGERRRLLSGKLHDVATDVRTFGLSDREALDLFRDVLSDHEPYRKGSR